MQKIFDFFFPRILVVAICIFGFSFATFIWPLIHLPLWNNPWEIHSYLAAQRFNPINNVLRFLAFISMPSVLFILVWFCYPKIRRLFSEKSISSVMAAGKNKIDSILFSFFHFALMYWALCSFSEYFYTTGSISISTFDFYHEGEWLAPAINYLANGKLWLGTYFVHGAMYDVFSAILGWKFFGIISIGAERLAVSFLQQLPNIVYAVLILILVRQIKKEKGYPYAIIYGSLLLIAYAVSFAWQNWDRRDLFVLLGIILTLYSVTEQKPKILFFSGLLSIASFFYTLDRGIYSVVGTIFLILILSLFFEGKKKYREIFYYLLGLMAGYALLLLIFGWRECKEAIQATIAIVLTKDLNDGYIYPQPGFPITNYRRLLTPHTLPMVSIGLQILLLLIEGLRLKWKFKRDTILITQIFFCIFSILFYKSALSRADGFHFRQASSFSIIAIGFLFASFLFNFVQFFKVHKKWLQFISIIFLLLVPLSYLSIMKSPQTMYSNLKDFYHNREWYIHRSDREFLTSGARNALTILEKEFFNETCLYSISGDPLWFYLLRKPSCGKYYISWLAAPNFLQEIAIEELKLLWPKKILVRTLGGGDALDGIPLRERIHKWYAFILLYYEPHLDRDGVVIFKKK